MKINDKYEISPFGNAFDSLFSLLARGASLGPPSSASLLPKESERPRARFKDEGDKIRLEFLVPGWKKSDLKLSITRGKLSLRAETASNKTESGLFQSQNLDLDVSLPENLDTEKATAKLEEGVLCVLIPRNPGSKEKRIKIG